MSNALWRRRWPVAILLSVLLILAAGFYGALRVAKDPIAKATFSHLWTDVWSAQVGDGLLLGSSSLAYLDAGRHLRCGDWINRGVSGATVEDLLTYLSWSPIGAGPRRVLIYAGENDLARSRSQEATKADYEALIALIRRRFDDASLFLLPIKFSPGRARFHDAFAAFNAWLAARAASDPKLTYLGSALSGASARTIAGAFRRDGVHLTDRGYRVFLEGFNAECLGR